MRKSVTMLGYKIEEDHTDAEVTGFAGLLPYMELWRRFGMPALVDQTVHICGSQGWLDRQIVEALVLLNIAGGDCVTDIDTMEADAGLCEMVRHNEYSGMGRTAVKSAQARFRRGRIRTFPAATQISTFLEACHDEKEEEKRVVGKAFIPKRNEHLRSLIELNAYLVEAAQRLKPSEVATLDCDATLVESQTKTALYSYKGFAGYQPFNIYWAEQQMTLHSQFRDGNVPAAFDLLGPIKEAVAMLPASVKTVRVRQDSAGYVNEIMAWLERADEHPQFGRIQFTISVDITPQFRQAVAQLEPEEWITEYKRKGGTLVPTGREFAEVPYVSSEQARLPGVDEPFRFIATREKMSSQLSLLNVGSECGQAYAPQRPQCGCRGAYARPEIPFPTMVMNNIQYKLHAIVTNRHDEPADDLIKWHYERCGKSEEIHSIMKGDFAGGQLPSAKFGANAAWWALMILSMNLHTLMKRHVLGDKWEKKRMKALRYELIATPARIVHHARQAFIRMHKPLQAWFLRIRASLDTLSLAQA